MTEHTPGPWFIAGSTHVYAAGEHGANICSVSQPRATSEVRYTEVTIGSDGFYEACANARLIAAAPELLAALHICRNRIMFICSERDLMSDEDAAILSNADAAIAKAEVRS